ncbi:MAG: hypothetical protein DIJKHBIC_01555 [Thermoanaerobaculia bacterium]|nr:hypothetical protein [Thermoanaerobaculia bacterium]
MMDPMGEKGWGAVVSDARFRIEAIGSTAAFVGVLWALAWLLPLVETRPGVRLPDPLLKLFSPVEVSWITFGLIYGAVILALSDLVRDPRRLMVAFRAYAILGACRFAGMWLTPLEAPEKIIVLRDPIVEFFTETQVLTRDLFFSGHTSLMFLLFLLAVKRGHRVAFLVATAGVAFCVLLQHVHYSVDVFAAPFFSYASVRVAGWFGEAGPAVREGGGNE